MNLSGFIRYDFSHSDATLTFPQTVVLRYTVQEIGVAYKAAESYRRWFVAIKAVGEIFRIKRIPVLR